MGRVERGSSKEGQYEEEGGGAKGGLKYWEK